LVDADPQLLLQLPDQGLLRPLARLDLAAGKFPQARHRLAPRAPRDQHAGVRIDESASGDEDEVHAHDPAIDHTRRRVKAGSMRSRGSSDPARWLMLSCTPRIPRFWRDPPWISGTWPQGAFS